MERMINIKFLSCDKKSCDIGIIDCQTCKWMAIVEVIQVLESFCFIVFWSVFKTNDDETCKGKWLGSSCFCYITATKQVK